MTQDIVQSLLSDQALTHATVYGVSAAAGQLLFAVKLWAAKEIDCIWDRFGNDIRPAVSAVITNITVLVGVISVLPLSEMPLSACVLTGLFQGLSADSVINKSKRREWTDTERAVRQDKP